MAVTGQNIADKAENILQDTSNTRWTEPELLVWINAGVKEILVYKPNANPVTESVVTVAGTKQTLPATGIQFLKAIRNMGTNGTTPGGAITSLDMNVLDVAVPGWHTSTANAVSQYACFDSRLPKIFYLSPPQPTSSMGYVEISYSKLPADLASLAASIFDDLYEMALVDYVLYRAFLKDAEFAGSAVRADGHFKAFLNALGVKSSNEVRYSSQRQAAAVPTPAQG